jgi:hypothetical protein
MRGRSARVCQRRGLGFAGFRFPPEGLTVAVRSAVRWLAALRPAVSRCGGAMIYLRHPVLSIGSNPTRFILAQPSWVHHHATDGHGRGSMLSSVGCSTQRPTSVIRAVWVTPSSA